MASDVTVNSAANAAQATTNSSSQLAEDFDDFLNLLTVQLQNQDPLDPADTSEFTSQLVAFSGVEQQINANQKLDSLVALSIGSSFSNALNYVGKEISYLSNEAFFDGDAPIDINHAITGTSVDTTINIVDEEGGIILSQQVSDDERSEIFTWDGRNENGDLVEAGTYSIRVDALDSDNTPLQTTTVVDGHVGGIETQNGITFLLVGERAVSIGNVINVQEARQTTTTGADDTSNDNSDTTT